MKRALIIASTLTTTSCMGMDMDMGTDLDGNIGRATQKQIMLNQLSNEVLMQNALTGSEESLTAVVSTALSDFGTDPVLGLQLMQPEARVLMDYLVSCALDAGQQVQWTNPNDPNDTVTWQGAHGVCTDWATAAPSVACQEAVSACLLARNNAKQKRVTLSTRGLRADGTAIPLADIVPAGTHVEGSQDAVGDQVASFVPCGVETLGVTRDCGWPAALALAGQCTAGQDVDVSAGTQPPGDCGGQVLRACDGISGCNHADALDEAEADCGGVAPTLSFVCPESGIFAAMAAPYRSTDPWDDAALTATGGVLPVAELDLFLEREGAYYGNIFDPATRSGSATVWVDDRGTVHSSYPRSGTVVIYEDMWACHDPGWVKPDAVMQNRLCATVEDVQICAANPLGSCDEVLSTDPMELRCDSDDGAPVDGDGDYAGCRDGQGNVRSRPLTVFLKEPCDMFSSPTLPDCARW